jgi:hypothetical protein
MQAFVCNQVCLSPGRGGVAWAQKIYASCEEAIL